MNILAINYEFPPIGGGGGVVFEQIMTDLAQRHRITVLTSAYRGLERFERRDNMEIHRVPVVLRKQRSVASMPSLLSFWPSSRRFGATLIKRQPFDLINSHFAVPSGPSADQLARRYGLPHVLSVHGGDVFDPSKWTSPHRLPGVRGMVKRLLRRADRVVAQSNDTADKARHYYGTQRQIDIIPLGIRPRPCAEVSRTQFDLAADRFVIITVGRLVARKNLGQLLRALADLDDPNDVLWIIGDGPQREALETQARQLGIAQRVRFEGYVEEPRKSQLLAVSDIYASTSVHEGFGLVFLEAMERGLPIVAFDHGGQRDFLEDGQTGVLTRKCDHGALVDAIRRLKQSPQNRHRIAQFNRIRVQDYTVAACAQRYEDLFDRVLTDKGHPNSNGT